MPQMTQSWILHLTEHKHTHSITYIIYVKTKLATLSDDYHAEQYPNDRSQSCN